VEAPGGEVVKFFHSLPNLPQLFLCPCRSEKMKKSIASLLQFERRAEQTGFQAFATELLAFGYKNAMACLFPVFIFAMLAVSNFFPKLFIPRYDFMLLACLLMQAVMYFSRLETKDELLVITLFHLLGLTMEIFKVGKGSWSYPDFAWTKIAGVPLYSGFMYASVASFMCQAWRRFSMQIERWPNPWLAFGLGAGIYLNFFTHHYLPDVRWWLALAVAVSFRKTLVLFNNNGIVRRMPLVLAFVLIGLFIWFAENIATFFGAWKYAYQHADWQLVSFHKISSWGLLVIVSFIIVAELKFVKERGTGRQGRIKKVIRQD
jgi:uncharacterized membrane protein YoaT (DUF817 family)